MIHFDFCIFFRWIGEEPPTRQWYTCFTIESCTMKVRRLSDLDVPGCDHRGGVVECHSKRRETETELLHSDPVGWWFVRNFPKQSVRGQNSGLHETIRIYSLIIFFKHRHSIARQKLSQIHAVLSHRSSFSCNFMPSWTFEISGALLLVPYGSFTNRVSGSAIFLRVC